MHCWTPIIRDGWYKYIVFIFEIHSLRKYMKTDSTNQRIFEF